MTDSDKHSLLLQYIIKTVKKSYSTGPTKLQKIFCIVCKCYLQKQMRKSSLTFGKSLVLQQSVKRQNVKTPILWLQHISLMKDKLAFVHDIYFHPSSKFVG